MERVPCAVMVTLVTGTSRRFAVPVTSVQAVLPEDAQQAHSETKKRNRIKPLLVKIVQRATTKLVLVNQPVQSVVRESFLMPQSKNQKTLAKLVRNLVTFVLREPAMPLRIRVLLVHIQIKVEQANARFVEQVSTNQTEGNMLALDALLECFSPIKEARQ